MRSVSRFATCLRICGPLFVAGFLICWIGPVVAQTPAADTTPKADTADKTEPPAKDAPAKDAPEKEATPGPAYKVYTFNPNALPVRDQNDLSQLAAGIVSGSEALAGHEADLKRYLVELILPRVIQMPKEGQVPKPNESFPTLRLGLKRKFLWAAKDPLVHDQINEIILKQLGDIAGENYHPLVRYYAMSLIADLNSTEPANARAPGVPMPEALAVLSRAVSADVPDAVRVAALTGILRHAESKLPAAKQAAVQATVLPLLAQANPPPGRSPEGHDWMRRRSADILGALGSVGQAGAVVTTLDVVVKDVKSPLSVRCSAAKALGSLDYTGATLPPKVVDGIVTDVARLATDASSRELEEARAQEAPLAAQRLKTYLHDIRVALGGPDDGSQEGLKALAQSPDSKRLDVAALVQVDAMLAATDASRRDPAAGAAKLTTAVAALNDLLKAQPGAAPAAAKNTDPKNSDAALEDLGNKAPAGK